MNPLYPPGVAGTVKPFASVPCPSALITPVPMNEMSAQGLSSHLAGSPNSFTYKRCSSLRKVARNGHVVSLFVDSCSRLNLTGGGENGEITG